MLLIIPLFCFLAAIVLLPCVIITELIFLILRVRRRRKTDPEAFEYKALQEQIRLSRSRLIAEGIALAAIIGLVFLLECLIVFNM